MRMPPRPFERSAAAARSGLLALVVTAAVVTAAVVVPAVVVPAATDAASAMPKWHLPFAKGESWQAGAPHGSTVWNALDFGPIGSSDRSVVAMARGRVIEVPCSSGSSYLGIDHGGGWETHYYHLSAPRLGLVGKLVKAGTRLGEAGTDVSCGGGATFSHVHVTFWHHGEPVVADGLVVGGYTAWSGGSPYWGGWLDAAGTNVVSANGGAACCLLSSTPKGGVVTSKPATCKGRKATITGTRGADVLVGTPGRDVIVGRGGNDKIRGRGGNDLVCAGRGNDRVHGGRGNDRLFGGKGKDIIAGNQGQDFCRGPGDTRLSCEL